MSEKEEKRPALTLPESLVLVAIVLVLGATTLAGPSLGVDASSMQWLQGGEGLAAMLAGWLLMRKPGAK